MDFTFSEDQILFRDSIRSVFLKQVAPELLRELWNTPEGRSQALWALLAEQGLCGFSVPEEYGGMAMSDLDWILIAQEVGYFTAGISTTSGANWQAAHPRCPSRQQTAKPAAPCRPRWMTKRPLPPLQTS